MVKNTKNSNPEQEKWNKLQKYKCSNYRCAKEFYFVKKEFEDKVEPGEFKDEPFSKLPIFLDGGICPLCGSSKFTEVLTEEEKKQKKEAEKEKLEKKLKEIAEEEARLEELYSSQMKEMCNEISSDIMQYLKELEKSLRYKEISIDRFETLFFDKAFEIMQRDTDLYNRRNKEVNLVLSARYKSEFRDAILYFNNSVRESLKSIEETLEQKSKQIEKEKELGTAEVTIERLENQYDEMKEESKEQFKEEIKEARKTGENSLDDSFKEMLRKEVKIK